MPQQQRPSQQDQYSEAPTPSDTTSTRMVHDLLAPGRSAQSHQPHEVAFLLDWQQRHGLAPNPPPSDLTDVRTSDLDSNIDNMDAELVRRKEVQLKQQLQEDPKFREDYELFKQISLSGSGQG